MMKKRNNPFDQQMKNIQSETNNPAIFDDVVHSDLDQYSGRSNQDLNGTFSTVDQNVKNPVDGKTWTPSIK